MAKQLLGRVAMDFKGEFNSSSTYEKLDVVVYEGCSYCTLKETKGNLPTNEEFFALLVRKPISGVDYFTEDEKEEFVSRITDDANSLFNQNVESKKKEFNTNHQDKVNDFNNNYDTKLSSFNSNYDSKVKSFNNNVNNQTTTFNENVTEKQKEFDNNVTNQTETFNTNVTNKINEYDTNASNKLNDYNSNDNAKLKAYNDNVSTKVEEYNTNANNKVEEYNTNAEEKTNEFNSTANAQKITNLSNEFYRVKDEVLETGEVSDTFIHLEDSSMSELQELEIEGVCQQETTNGINLLPEVADKSTRTSGGVTLTFSENNKMNLKGTTSDKSIYFDMKLKETISLTKDVYVHIRNNVGNGNVAIALLLDNSQKGWHSLSDINTISNFTDIKSDEFEVNTLRFFINPNQTVNVTLQPSLENTVDTTNYEPYTGGNASPNPEYPQEIKTITKELNVTNCGKNLLKAINYSNTHNGINYIFNNNSVSAKGISTSQSISIDSRAAIKNGFLSILDKGKYVLKISSSNAIVELVNESGNMIVKTFSSNSVTKFELKEPTKYFYRIVIPENTTVDEIFYLQLEKGKEGTPIEEQVSSQITVKLPEGEFIGKIDDNNKDTLNIKYNEEDGLYHFILDKVIGKIILDGTQSIFLRETSQTEKKSVCVRVPGNVVNNTANCLCDHLIPKNLDNLYATNVGITTITKNVSYYGNIIFFREDFSNKNVSEINQLLAKKNMQVFYVLQTPYELDLGPVEMPLSYNEVTNIFTDSDLLPKINAKYYRNFIKTIQNLQVNDKALKQELVDINNRLTALETAQANIINDIPTEESEVTE